MYKGSYNSERRVREKISILYYKIYYSPTSCLLEELAVVDVRCCGFSWYITSNYVGLYVYVYICIFYGLCVVGRITRPVTELAVNWLLVWWIVSAATPVLYIRLSYMQSLSVEFIRE
jgi:hypothetical protein